MYDSLERHLVLAVGTLLFLGVLVILIVLDFGGEVPLKPSLRSMPTRATNAIPARQWEPYFALMSLTNRKSANNLSNPFYQPQFQPPAPPPPKTRKVDLTFLGFFTTTHGEKRAYLQVGDQMLVCAIGAKVVADLTVVDVTTKQLTLKDGAAKETPLPFRVKQTVEVPL